MKMKEYTKKEINLFKQIKALGVEFEPSDDWHGAYYVYHQDRVFPWADGEDKPYYKTDEFVWLGDISDCLEFFKEREYTFERAYQLGGIFHIVFTSGKGTIKGSGDTFLIACLKAVLASLEEE